MRTTPCPCLPQPPTEIRMICCDDPCADPPAEEINYLSCYLWRLHNALSTNFSWIYMDLVDFRKEAKVFIHCYDYATSDYGIWAFTEDGIYVTKWTTPSWNQENNMCVDSSYNVYMTDVAGGAWNVIKKWDRNGTLLVTKTTDWTEGIAISPDGYLYTRQLDGSDKVIVKRDPNDLTTMSQIAMTTVGRCFTFDPDGYFYIFNKTSNPDIQKWDYDTGTMIASHATTFHQDWASLAYADGYIGYTMDGGDVYTIKTSLDEDQSSGWGVPDPTHIAAISDNFIVAEYNHNGNKYYNLVRYTSAGAEVWNKNIEYRDNITVYGVAAYPF